jgi:hypothetical protein
MVRNRQPTPASLVTAVIVARGAERHGACVTPQSGCHELLKVWPVVLMSEPQRPGLLRKTGHPIRRDALTWDTAPAVSRVSWRSAPSLGSATR